MKTGDNGGSGGLPPAGWYPDATNPGRERLWTGERWTDRIRQVKPGRTEPDPAGWRPDPARPALERLWAGDMWTEETRRAAAVEMTGGGATGAPAAPAPPAEPAPALQHGIVYHDSRPPIRLAYLGAWTRVALVGVIAAAIAHLIADQLYIGVLDDFIDGRPSTPSHAESVVDAVHTTHTIFYIVEAVTAILFVVWFYRSYANLIRAGIRNVRFAPGWAVGGWLIPFFNLVRPKQVANDIWKGSASAGSVGIERWREVALPALINWWWGIWIFAGLCFLAGSRGVTRASVTRLYQAIEPHHDRARIWYVQIGLGASIVAAVLAFLLVREITRMQDDTFGAVAPGDATEHASATAPTSVGEAIKTCPDCAEDVKAAARVCRWCGYRFADPA